MHRSKESGILYPWHFHDSVTGTTIGKHTTEAVSLHPPSSSSFDPCFAWLRIVRTVKWREIDWIDFWLTTTTSFEEARITSHALKSDRNFRLISSPVRAFRAGGEAVRKKEGDPLADETAPWSC